MQTFQIENVDWLRGRNRLKPIRHQVFVLEWRLPENAEFDNADKNAHHVLVKTQEQVPIATGRLTKEGTVGRIAVLPSYRSLPVYKALFGALLQIAKRQQIAKLTFQCHYHKVKQHEAIGFTPVGNVYMEAGIPMQKISCPTNQFCLPDVKGLH